MKKYIKNAIYTTAITISILTISCDNGLDGAGYGDDPNNTDSAPTANILGLAELAAGSLNQSDNSRFAGINANYLSGLDQQFGPINNYIYSPGDFSGLWTTIYQDGIKPAKIAATQGADSGDNEMVGTAQLLQALFLIEAAANWGDVPNSEATVMGILEPIYDTQMSVYQSAIGLLNDAITNANNSTKYFNDGIGGTSTSSTIGEIANTLKARTYLLMHDYPNALISAQNGIQNPNGDLLLNHTSIIGAKNMYYQFLVEQRGGYIGPNNSYLEIMLNSTNASVTRTLITPGDSNRYNFYYTSPAEFNTNAGGVFADNASIAIVSYYENKLIEAESAYRGNQEIIARNSLNAVRDELASKFGGLFPHSSATGTTLLTHILEEKYISIFPSSQTFHDLSRTNNALGVTPKTGTVLPERFLYSQDEIDANGNVPNPLPNIFVPTPAN